MFSLSPNDIIATLQAGPPEFVWLLMLLVAFGAIVVMGRLFGEAGLVAYVVIAIIGANIQVLKVVQFGVFGYPLALGTVLFASSFLATDILTEHYGRRAAQRAVLIGFFALALWTVIMILTLGFAPLTPEQAGTEWAWALGVQGAMETLFTPVTAFFVAGMAAYLLSQFHDVWLYSLLKRLTRGRHLWLRNNASTWISAFIDTVVFSVLAWVVFAPEPIGVEALVFTYILGTYWLRVIVALLDTPFIYLAHRAIKAPTPAASAA